MTLLIGALSLGFIFGLLALGTYISFRIFDIPDITVDGSVTLGGAVAAVLLLNERDPFAAIVAGGLAGFAAGCITGLLQTRCRINPLLAGILVMTGLYSINLKIMGKSNLPLLDTPTLGNRCQALWKSLFGTETLSLFGWRLSAHEVATLIALGLIVGLVAFLLYLFFRTDLGTAMRASGDNEQMTRALGVNVENYRIVGLGLSNGLVGLSGALWVQYQGFADAQMGIGMVVVGLASVIIGEALTSGRGLGYAICGTLMGAILFRELLALALQWGLDPIYLKLATAVFVFAALVFPQLLRKVRGLLTLHRPSTQS